MFEEDIDKILLDNDIDREHCELFSDYIQSLFMLVFRTYMGDKITTPSEQKNHFRWCWNKNVSNFKEEGYHINSSELYDYFETFTNDAYYKDLTKENNVRLPQILSLWRFILNIDKPKSKVDVILMIKIYNNFKASKINY